MLVPLSPTDWLYFFVCLFLVLYINITYKHAGNPVASVSLKRYEEEKILSLLGVMHMRESKSVLRLRLAPGSHLLRHCEFFNLQEKHVQYVDISYIKVLGTFNQSHSG